MTAPDPRIPVAVLGATGLVGQRFVAALARHPHFRAAQLLASPRSAGQRYADAVRWALPGDPPAELADMQLGTADAASVRCPLVLSALGSELAGPLEEQLADRGCAVISNASSHRMDADVPLLIPEVNPHHVEALQRQRARRGGVGFIVTNPNCASVGVVLPLAPLQRAFGIRRVLIVTLQALSGAGLRGTSGLELSDNVLPFIAGEAEKLEQEPRRLLGRFHDGAFADADFVVSARVHRVPVSDGHLAAVSVETERPVTPAQARELFADFRGEPQELGLHSAPARPLHVLDGPRPQPRLDRDREGGMAVSVGGVEVCPVLGLRFESLVHNTVRGAAGAALLNAEWLLARGELDANLEACS